MILLLVVCFLSNLTPLIVRMLYSILRKTLKLCKRKKREPASLKYVS